MDTNNGASTNNNPASSGTAISGNLTALDSLNPESLSGGAVAMGNMTRDEQHLDESFKQHPHATSSSNASAAAIGAGGVAATTSADSVLAEEGGVVGEREFNGRAPAPSVTKRISTNTITTTTSKKLFKGNYYFIQKKDMEDTRKALLDPRVRHIRPSTYPTKTSTTAASALNEGGKSSKKSDPSMTDAELEEIQDSVAPLSSKDKPLTKSKKNLPGPAPSRTRISVVQGSSGLRRSRRGRNSVRGRGGDDAKQQEMDKSNASVVVFNSERGWADFKHKYTIELMREETMHEEEKQKVNEIYFSFFTFILKCFLSLKSPTCWKDSGKRCKRVTTEKNTCS